MLEHHADALDIQAAVQLALVGRYYERIGDHAVNIGERVQYMVSGWLPEHTGRGPARRRARLGRGRAVIARSSSGVVVVLSRHAWCSAFVGQQRLRPTPAGRGPPAGRGRRRHRLGPGRGHLGARAGRRPSARPRRRRVSIAEARLAGRWTRSPRASSSATSGDDRLPQRGGRRLPRGPPRRGARRGGHRRAGRGAARALDGVAPDRTLDLFGPPAAHPRARRSDSLDGAAPARRLVVIDDVTERRRLEAVRRDFVANISHELKTPVGALGLLAETLARRGRPRRRPAPGRAHARRGVPGRPHHRRPARAVAASRPTRRPAADPVPVHLVVAEAVERVRPAAEQRGITDRGRRAAPPASSSSATAASSSPPSTTCSRTP